MKRGHRSWHRWAWLLLVPLMVLLLNAPRRLDAGSTAVDLPPALANTVPESR